MAKQIPTSEEFIREKYKILSQTNNEFSEEIDEDSLKAATEWQIEFAKLHVEAALKDAANSGYWSKSMEQAILNSYPLTNIK